MEDDVVSDFLLKDVISKTDRCIQVLNYTNGETIDYPFVLLECKITEPISFDNRLEGSSCGQDGTSAFQGDFVLVNGKNDCRSWPVVRGGFKALLQLNAGENLIRFKACMSGVVMEDSFTLSYIPSTLRRFVRVVYIKCSDSDGTFEAPQGVVNDVDMATKKLAFNSRLLQTFTAQDMHHHGFGHKTFRIEEDCKGKPEINVFTSSLTSAEALKMTGGQLYDRFSQELAKSHLYNPLCKFWAFMSCTRYEPPPPEHFNDKDIHLYVKAHTALGGGQLALFGTGNLHTWASETDELISCFTNTEMIDRSCLFDDSARRGSYWANYATGLGASIHELGHCFDLAHTPGGIMGRGFDDFNCVFSLWRKPPLHGRSKCEPSKITKECEEISCNEEVCTASDNSKNVQQNVHLVAKGLVQTSNDEDLMMLHDNNLATWINDETNLARPGDWSHGAKWYRSSAVILRYHKWFSNEEESNREVANHPVVHWSHRFYGPAGVISANNHCNKTSFNDRTWLTENDAELVGYVIHTDAYVNSIQTIGKTLEILDGTEKPKEILSEPRGRIFGRKYVFKMEEPGEYVTAIDVRAGAWIDAIRIHTNYKSSVLMGGGGGCFSHFEPPEEKRIVGMFGCAGEFVGSIGIFLESHDTASSTVESRQDEDLVVVAPNGLRLIELHDKKHDEVYKHWEFLGSPPPTRFLLKRDDIVAQEARIVIMDDKGNMNSSGPFCGLEKMFATIAAKSQVKAPWTESGEEGERTRNTTEVEPNKDPENCAESKHELNVRTSESSRSDFKIKTEQCREKTSENETYSKLNEDENDQGLEAQILLKRKDGKEVNCEDTLTQSHYEPSQNPSDCRAAKQQKHEDSVTRYY